MPFANPERRRAYRRERYRHQREAQPEVARQAEREQKQSQRDRVRDETLAELTAQVDQAVKRGDIRQHYDENGIPDWLTGTTDEARSLLGRYQRCLDSEVDRRQSAAKALLRAGADDDSGPAADDFERRVGQKLAKEYLRYQNLDY